MTESALEQWVEALAEELNLDFDNLDVQALLDVARDAAHSVVRPAAPISTFLIGYAAGKRSAAGDDIAAECGRASALADGWESE